MSSILTKARSAQQWRSRGVLRRSRLLCGVSMYNAGVQSREVNMKRRVILLAMVILILGLATIVHAQGTSNEPAAVQKHVDAARAMAGTKYKIAMERLCMPPDKRPRPQFTDL